MLLFASTIAPFRPMQIRITDPALKTLIKRSGKEAGRSNPKQVEYLIRLALISINKKL